MTLNQNLNNNEEWCNFMVFDNVNNEKNNFNYNSNSQNESMISEHRDMLFLK